MRKTGAMPIEAYATTTWRSCTSILHTMSAPEIRRALEMEWRGQAAARDYVQADVSAVRAYRARASRVVPACQTAGRRGQAAQGKPGRLRN